nr:putative nucleotidyltransferase, ribonuclease H [Tanacetum cinerariifolium]
MCKFDIILGMDWLTEHRATIDCCSYRVIFGDIHAPEFIYHGSLPGKSMQIISALQARTLLSHGCKGFLATIHDTTSDVPSIHDQPIVSQFPDVFPDELPWIPPVREVEFNIELIPGSEPISKAPYRMAPIELKDLKDQLQELVKKIVWNEEREKSLEELKKHLVSTPVLTLPSGSGGFQIYSDASKKGLGSRVEHETEALVGVVVDRLTKSAHFLPIRKDYSVSRLAEIFQQKIVRLHGTPSAIVSDRDTHFASRFWKGLQKAWGTRLKFSTAFHPQTDGQSERTIQTLEDMLRSCALEKCRASICWDQIGERVIEGPEMIEVTNAKVAVAKEKLKEARTRQKSYADKHRRSLEFQSGDHVFLKVSPARGVGHFGIKGKLSPHFIGPFEIHDRVGEVSYRLALPPQLSHVHNVFHVSLLRGYKYHPLHVISYPLDQIHTYLSYVEEPEAILDRQDRVMRKKTIPFIKILWRNHPEREATWETEESIRTSYTHFFP